MKRLDNRATTFTGNGAGMDLPMAVRYAKHVDRQFYPVAFRFKQTQPGMVATPRLASPGEIAQVSLLLASDEPSFLRRTWVTSDRGGTLC